MGCYVLGFDEIDQSQVALVGGKGAHLGELTRLEGIHVPAGFCVTTDAFRRVVAEVPELDEAIVRLSRLTPDDRPSIRTLSGEVRRIIETVIIPNDLSASIIRHLERVGDDLAYAVRSSATAEDLPSASFAGQQDTFLNVIGSTEILRHIIRCWASLFSERAVTYRLRAGIGHDAQMAVVVQQMVFPEASGILFTADPVTSNRKVVSVEAVFGLGEALVSGLVNADIYTVRDGVIFDRSIATKELAIHALPSGGTQEQVVEPERQHQPVLADEQVVRLAQLGRRIESHFGGPQDIEWCEVADEFQIVQSRPITTLFPIPNIGDQENHVYVSVGHQQMMTDPMKPLGLSLFQMTAGRPMFEAGGRLFVDVTRELSIPARRAGLLAIMGKGDPLIVDALKTILDRGDFIHTIPDDGPVRAQFGAQPEPIPTDPAIVAALIRRTQDSLAALKGEIREKSGLDLIDFIVADISELKRVLFDPQSSQAIMAGMEANWWLNDHLEEWLSEKNVADTLTLSVPDNVTAEMGLALLDVADVIRPYPKVIDFLQQVKDDTFLEELPSLPGGPEAHNAICAYLDKYGMRCVGEIDITRPRWSERPSTLLPILLGNVMNFEPGAGKRRFERGLAEARAKEREVLDRLRVQPDGQQKAVETKRMIDRVRTFSGFREYPKYGMICRYFVYKQALMAEAARLVRTGVLREVEDLFYFSFPELRDVVRTNHLDKELVDQRKDAFKRYEALTPPRVLTSDGEIVAGKYQRENQPDGALIGLAVSSGVVEGRARVVLDMADADLEPGDILVTPHTDPSWTPLFVTIEALVTEVGGLMTHGAVIAREYGLPAVVGVQQATRIIQDGQRIRVNGTVGYVEILS